MTMTTSNNTLDTAFDSSEMVAILSALVEHTENPYSALKTWLHQHALDTSAADALFYRSSHALQKFMLDYEDGHDGLDWTSLTRVAAGTRNVPGEETPQPLVVLSITNRAMICMHTFILAYHVDSAGKVIEVAVIDPDQVSRPDVTLH
jgi:hypothetical protein